MGLALFLGLALAILAAAACWLAVLTLWPYEREKAGGRLLPRVVLAALSTAAAVGAWYALVFVASPSGA